VKARGLYVSVEEGAGLDRRARPRADPQVVASGACGPAAPAQHGAAGWCTYFRHGVSKATFAYLDDYAWHRVVRWIRKRHNKTKWAVLMRRYLPRWRPTEDEVTLFQPQAVTVSRYRHRAANIPAPWASQTPRLAR
jgi:hypothetical protein